MESGHENPKLAEIDIALSKLESCIESLAHESGYEITRSHDSSFNIPRRWIRRTTELDGRQVRHQAEILIGVPIDVRLERGFYPEIPLEITAGATLAHLEPFSELLIYKTVAEALPYSEANEQLPELFRKIRSLHEQWDADFITEHGETIDKFIARSKEEDDDDSNRLA
ncbi:MAG: hypothetical protein KDN22_07290 [Verrucomicrobiae bacterium]|nr:hypothetical protein [Verrucomicrobiae bacterium]